MFHDGLNKSLFPCIIVVIIVDQFSRSMVVVDWLSSFINQSIDRSIYQSSCSLFVVVVAVVAVDVDSLDAVEAVSNPAKAE